MLRVCSLPPAGCWMHGRLSARLMSFSSSFPQKTHWKPPIILLPPSVSVSFVLAQPEQTRSTSSAAADNRLPNILRAMLPSQTNSTTPVAATEGHDQSSVTSGDSSAQPPANAADGSNQSSSGAVSSTPLLRHTFQLILY